jgi:sugar O-acyltransferase (sialic acid O-acetyltransferase NeuD family)
VTIKLVIYGAGGFAAEILWTIERINLQKPTFEILGICDDAEQPFATLYGYPFFGRLEDARKQISADSVFFHVAIGSNRGRQAVTERCQQVGWQLASVIDPSVLIAPSASVGAGVYLGAGTIVCPNVDICMSTIVNLHCSVGHDSRLGRFSQLCPGARVSGNGMVGEGAFLGTNALIGPGVQVGDWALLGAGSVGLKNIPAGEKFGGVPAKKIN